jgi:hypothetical protein
MTNRDASTNSATVLPHDFKFLSAAHIGRNTQLVKFRNTYFDDVDSWKQKSDRKVVVVCLYVCIHVCIVCYILCHVCV